MINGNQQLEERQVRTGLETPDLIEIASGLHEHELVLIGSRNGLQPGQRVDAKLMQPSGVGGAD